MRLLLHGATLGGVPELSDLIEAAAGGFAGVEAPWASVQAACRRGAGGFARRMARMGLCVAASDAPLTSFMASPPTSLDGRDGGAAVVEGPDATDARLEAAGQLLRGLAAFGVGVPLMMVRVAARRAAELNVRERLARMGRIAEACGLRLTLDVVDDSGVTVPSAVSEALAAAVPWPGIGVVADSLAGPPPVPAAAFARLRGAPGDSDATGVAWAAALYRGGYRGCVAVVAPPRLGRGEDGLAAAARGLRFAQGVLRRAGI